MNKKKLYNRYKSLKPKIMKNISGNVKGWTGKGGGNQEQSQSTSEINVFANEPKAIPSIEEMLKKGAEFKASLEKFYEQYKHKNVYSGMTNVDVILNEIEALTE